MTRRLLVSIHDVSPKHEGRIDRLRDMIAAAGIGERYAMLVVPDFWGEWPLEHHPAFRARLRGWADTGVEMFLHGWFHRDLSAHSSGADAFKARFLTASEGEFLGLDRKAATERLLRGRALLEDVLGRPVDRFVAPAWLYSDDAKAALADLGFRIAEDHFRVWDPLAKRQLARGPVISYATRTRARLASSLAFSRVATMALRPLRDVRVALHPHDVDAPSLLREIPRALAAFGRTHRPARYDELLAA